MYAPHFNLSLSKHLGPFIHYIVTVGGLEIFGGGSSVWYGRQACKSSRVMLWLLYTEQ